jgi:flagellar protein FliO/FliZ
VTFVVALVVIVIFFFLAWFLTRIIATNGSSNGKGKHITVIEKFPISRDSSLMIIKVTDKILLVGVTANGMTTLKEIDQESFDLDINEVKKQSFADVFKSTLESSFPDGRVKSAIDKVLHRRKGGDDDEA